MPTDFHASFKLADGTVADICADAACGDVLELLREVHSMSSLPGNNPLARIVPLTRGETHSIIAGSSRLQAEYPAGKLPELYLRAMPADRIMQAAVSRNIMFLALLPLFRSERMYLFHGGLAVDGHGHGCIICGPSGVGKSTAVAKAGTIWEILSDDLLYLSFLDGRCFAQPGPTWSTYLTEKARLVQCDINRIVEVKNTVILTRTGANGLRSIDGYMADLMLAGSFVDMTGWQALGINDNSIAVGLKKCAFNGTMRLSAATKCHILTSELETDITPWLNSLE